MSPMKKFKSGLLHIGKREKHLINGAGKMSIMTFVYIWMMLVVLSALTAWAERVRPK